MRAAVCGSPIAHSLSPALHRAAYAALGLDGWEYGALEVDEDGLPALVASLDAGWAGLSLTMPLKRAVLPLVDEVDAFARAVGAVNTVVVTPRQDAPAAGRAGVRLRAENTDVHGVVAALAEAGATRVHRGAVVGGGATARSALVALLRAGCPRPVAVVRSPERAGQLRTVAERVGGEVEVRDWSRLRTVLEAEVVVSTVPAGASRDVADVLAPAAAPGGARPAPLLLDVVYAPWPTPLAGAWPGPVVGGFEMLLHQGAAQVELMTGRRAPLAAMREAGLAQLRARAQA
ncbi:shikimate dehydrogenase [Kineococcus indalonis]|uniref:shikimate dehydrogenase n=1 Tax=Kineococcus indalonis TaxID=2696566 RepID=UPI0014129E14|nr:shikimate dehydrogenase [Kineococcus indalonis]NAZ87014.1 shikimate dehydrogenase [Kineococcus indalonis]